MCVILKTSCHLLHPLYLNQLRSPSDFWLKVSHHCLRRQLMHCLCSDTIKWQWCFSFYQLCASQSEITDRIPSPLTCIWWWFPSFAQRSSTRQTIMLANFMLCLHGYNNYSSITNEPLAYWSGHDIKSAMSAKINVSARASHANTEPPQDFTHLTALEWDTGIKWLYQWLF
mgnify:CR=1 FL=1